jgi:hypothetical protein
VSKTTGAPTTRPTRRRRLPRHRRRPGRRSAAWSKVRQRSPVANTHTHSSRSPPSQGGRPLGPRGEPLALRWRSRGSSGTLWAGKRPDLGRTEPPTSLLLHCALDHAGSRNSTASGSTPSAAGGGGAVAEPVRARAGRSCPLLVMLGSEHRLVDLINWLPCLYSCAAELLLLGN